MKKIKTFNVGDKVFAKVKGYPAWPAKIVGENGKKYDVTFYGTRETGSIKAEDIFYYLKHKEQFCKNLKRKDYIEAVEQIEEEIGETGTDGNNESNSEADKVATPDNTADKRNKKRKRSKSVDKSQNSEDTPAKKSVGGRNSLLNINADNEESKEEKTDEEKSSQCSETLEATKSANVSPKAAATPTSRSGRIIKVKKFSDGEEEDTEKKVVQRRRSIGSKDIQDEPTKAEDKEKEEVEAPKRKKSVTPQENKEESEKEDAEKKEAKPPNRRKSIGSKENQKDMDKEIKKEPVRENQNQTSKENQKQPPKEIDVKEGKGNEEEKVIKSEVEVIENEVSVDEVDENTENIETVMEVVKTEAEVVGVEEAADINIVSTDYLKAVIAYADYVRSKESIFKKKNVEPREKEENEVVISKLPSGKQIGIKYNTDSTSEHSSEFSRAEADGAEAKTILSLKDLVENGSCKPEDDPNLFIVNVKLDEAEIQRSKEQKIIECKLNRLKLLKVESGLVDLDSKIKGCLGLDKAEPKKALEYLESMLELNVSSLMLRKHPHIVDMVKRLRRYIGNIKEWNLTGDSLETFEADAQKIREKAEEVFRKFKSLFTLPEGASFWDTFSAEVEKFKDDTKDLKENEIFALCSEPNSRQAFFESFDQDVEVLENEEKEKENSSEVANSEQLVENTETAAAAT